MTYILIPPVCRGAHTNPPFQCSTHCLTTNCLDPAKVFLTLKVLQVNFLVTEQKFGLTGGPSGNIEWVFSVTEEIFNVGGLMEILNENGVTWYQYLLSLIYILYH